MHHEHRVAGPYLADRYGQERRLNATDRLNVLRGNQLEHVDVAAVHAIEEHVDVRRFARRIWAPGRVVRKTGRICCSAEYASGATPLNLASSFAVSRSCSGVETGVGA